MSEEQLLGSDEIARRHGWVDPSWQVDEGRKSLNRNFKFKDFHQTIGFVNALAWIANQLDHHPDMEVGYNYCNVHFSTHSAGGLTEKDFNAAAKIDALVLDV